MRFALARMRSSAPAVWRPKFLRPRNEVQGSPRWKTLKEQKSPPYLRNCKSRVQWRPGRSDLRKRRTDHSLNARRRKVGRRSSERRHVP